MLIEQGAAYAAAIPGDRTPSSGRLQGNAVSLTAFVVVIIGGMGSFAGAIVCGLMLGLAEALWGGYVSISTVKLVGFALVIMILMFKPYGLFSTPSERAS